MKGFTLIELLGVIVVIAIIALILVPLVIGVIDKSEEGAAIDSGYNYIDAVEKTMAIREIKK